MLRLRVLRRAAAAAVLLALSACAELQPARAIRIATGSTSHALCSGLFISGRDPQQTWLEEMRPQPGMGLIAWGMRFDVDRGRREVRTSFAGLAESRAVYRDALGCVVVRGVEPPAVPLDEARTPPAAEPAMPVVAADPRIRAAIDDAFEEPASGSPRGTQAVVVMHRGRVVAERYAPGIGIDTPLHGHSISKSVAHALVGVLVRQGRLAPEQGIAAWRDPSDPRRNVTLEQLLRNTSGLPADETMGGFDASSRMWFIERDMAAFAERGELEAAPGTRWNYSNLGFMLLSRSVRDAAGGSAGDVLRFAQRELFAPLRMHRAVIEFDAAGTPLLSSHVYASARAWARFGQLYLDDGIADGRRVLPEGWVQAARVPSLGTGYGAAFWLNHTDAPNPWGGRWGMRGAPEDAYFARGYLGQFVVVVPSRQLVVVRLGVTHRPAGDVDGVGRLVGRLVDALPAAPAPASAEVSKLTG
jgi:CubicO group peptidase (beta-lactamase class C family)